MAAEPETEEGTALSTVTGLDEVSDAYDAPKPAFGCGIELKDDGSISL